MSLRDKIDASARALVRRELVQLPTLGMTVQVRGLMLGDTERAGEKTGFLRVALLTALGTEDPETGELIWNPNSLEDHNRIAALPPGDGEVLVQAILRLSGKGAEAEAEGKGASGETVNSAVSSPSESVYLLPS